MKNILILFLVAFFVGCNQESKNVDNADNAEWSGTISENNPKTETVKNIMKSYVNNNMSGMKEFFHEDAEISVNDTKLTFDEMVAGFAEGHNKFDNIAHSNVLATTMFYNNGRVFTNSWYDWSGISKKTGEEVNLRGYCSWQWENDKIISVYNAFDPTEYNKGFED